MAPDSGRSDFILDPSGLCVTRSRSEDRQIRPSPV